MPSLTLLADHDTEVINGGFWSSYTSKYYSHKSATTTINQDNTANNIGVGLLYGYGNATSEQLNLAYSVTAIG